MSKKLTTEQFIHKAREIHGDYYDYSLVVYVNARTKVKIICPIHGEFKQRMDHHKKGHECKKCSTKTSANSLLRPIKEIISLAKNLHEKENYDYSLNTKDLKAKENMIILCPIHGEFKQSYDRHLRGSKCPTCSQINGNNLKRKSTETFIEEANILHQYKYSYIKTNYINNKQKVIIICPIHR